jgi:hypothetical protein
MTYHNHLSIKQRYSKIIDLPAAFDLDIEQFKQDVRDLLEIKSYTTTLIEIVARKDALELIIVILEYFEGLEDHLWAGVVEELQYNLNHCTKMIENHPIFVEARIKDMTFSELLTAYKDSAKEYRKNFNKLFRTKQGRMFLKRYA